MIECVPPRKRPGRKDQAVNQAKGKRERLVVWWRERSFHSRTAAEQVSEYVVSELIPAYVL